MSLLLCRSDPPLGVVSGTAEAICLNGKAGGADQGCVDLMVFTVRQLNRTFTHQIKEKLPAKQRYRTEQLQHGNW